MFKSIEQRLVALMTGGDNSPLLTDAYKFAMAQAGFPLRPEVFYLSFRRGDPMYVPFDIEQAILLMRPRLPDTKEAGFLAANGYAMTPAMEFAITGDLDVMAASAKTWALPKEPYATVRGASFLVSWLEPLIIALNFPIQVATAIMNGQRKFETSCADEAAIVQLMGEACGLEYGALDVLVREDVFRAEIRQNLMFVNKAVDKDIGRVFECGTRAMTCLQSHRIVLEECKKAGIYRTANVKLAYELYLTPVGTTGHEHQQRWMNDVDGFMAIRDARPEPPSFLFDTRDAMRIGIPAALAVAKQCPGRRASVRFDSGDQPAQLKKFVDEGALSMNLFYIFMDGYGPIEISNMEKLGRELGINKKDRHYGIGSYLASKPSPNPFGRDVVQAVYKICQSGEVPVMKHAQGKSSVPGVPVSCYSHDGRVRYIAQEFEKIEGTYSSGEAAIYLTDKPDQVEVKLSPQTQALVDQCRGAAGFAA